MSSRRSVTAVLGPTNTGKTHLAVERMIAHGSGMIGLPLRLLAREVYDRVRLKVGDHAAALVTGEEKIIPARPRFWICTVEAMPADIDVSFLAIDEIQLACDFERGHIFTDRLLHRRGLDETMLLGAATMRPILDKLLPGSSFVSRPRFSKLSYAGQKKLSRLPRRTAIVAFSADMVYAVAELIRRQRGGAAVVLGALSPRTRNAQVALYQSGDVDYIVATDAIGMGLNMDVDHVAFATTRKFDGFHYRNLNPAELGQIAGRAGRYLNDGTFGVTGEAEPLEADIVERLENHQFDNVPVLQWRNREIDVSSLDALRQSLAAPPRAEGLTRAMPGPDVNALETLARDDAVAALAGSPQSVARLWEVCQIPDYRDISANEHSGLVARIFEFLMTGNGRIPEDWFARQLADCDHSEGDIDALSNRISHIRTWTFVANRTDWLEAPLFWQSRAREIEDKLSDALHERLTQRFIDRRTSVLMKRLARKEVLMSHVEEDGAILVEGEYVGRIKGFDFVPDGAASDAHGKTLKAASLKAVTAEIAARAQTVAACPDPDLTLTRHGEIIWQGAAIARLEPGGPLLKPRIAVGAPDYLFGSEREAVQARLEKFLSRHIASVLEPLVKLEEAEGLAGICKGIAFRLVETLGILPRDQVAAEAKGLAQEERATLRAQGVRFGALNIYVPGILKPAATELRLLLWAVERAKEEKVELATLPPPPGHGLTSAPFDRSTPKGFYRVCGYRICGPRVVRIDMLERLADLIRSRVFWRPRFPGEPRPQGSVEGGGFTITPEMMSLVGCSGDEFQAILRSLDFRMQKRKVKTPAAVAEKPALAPSGPPPEPAVQPQPEAAVSPPAEPIAGPAMTPLSEPIAEPPTAPLAEPVGQPPTTPLAEPVAEPSTAPSTEPGTEPTAPLAVSQPAQPPEEIEMEIWWPKDTGPFHRPLQRKPKRAERPRRVPKTAQPAEASKPEPKILQETEPPPPKLKPRPRRERPPERPPSPDSPFAVLGELRARLIAKKT